MVKKQTARDLLKQIEGARSAHVFIGVAQGIEEDEDGISFSRGADCTRWTRVPVELIESIEYLQNIYCRDHVHPLVRLTLREPASDEAKVFAALAEPHGPPHHPAPAPPAATAASEGGSALLHSVPQLRMELAPMMASHAVGPALFHSVPQPRTELGQMVVSHGGGPMMFHPQPQLRAELAPMVGLQCGWIWDVGLNRYVYRCF